jgi:hypothetical protein
MIKNLQETDQTDSQKQTQQASSITQKGYKRNLLVSNYLSVKWISSEYFGNCKIILLITYKKLH